MAIGDPWHDLPDWEYELLFGDDKPTVCVVHKRFVPCRANDKCRISTKTDDVEMVRKYQSGDLCYISWMPATIPANIALRQDFRAVVTEAIALNELLEHIISIKSWQGNSGTQFHGKVSHSPPPWNSGAANQIFELHAWSRQAECYMRTIVGLPYRPRGGSSGNTKHALSNLVKLSEATPDHPVKDNKIWLNGWCNKAEIVLGKEEAAKRLPREHGQPEPTCPWCKQTTLRSYAVRGEVFCLDPTCKDEEGKRPKAMLEYFHGDLVLRWQDGVMS